MVDDIISKLIKVVKKISAYDLITEEVVSQIPFRQKTYVIGMGKAATQMLDQLFKKKQFDKGIAFTKYGHSIKTDKFKSYEASHPIIDESGIENGFRLLRFLEKVKPEDQLIVCLSGGASAVCEILNDDVSFEEYQKINMEMIFSRMPIHEINTIRKRYSKLKGGGLINLSPTKHIYTLAISDISFDDIWAIGSGPTETTRFKDLDDIHFKVIGDYEVLKQKAFDVFQVEKPYICDHPMDMSMEEGVTYHLDLLKHHKVIISGGELTLDVKGEGMGGRNTEFVLRMAKELFVKQQRTDVLIVSLGTDGTDGPTDAAGAWIDYQTFKKKPSIDKYLKNNDSYSYFEELGTLIKTGPTGTNIMDLRYIRVNN